MGSRVTLFVAGVDEVGRGPLAGPVAVGRTGTRSLRPCVIERRWPDRQGLSTIKQEI